MQSIAFVTPTYPPDLGRCELLVESVRHFAPAINHYLVIDGHDVKYFAHLAGPRTIIVPSEEVMHKSYHRIPGDRGIWLNWRTLPLRGWMSQQLRKLSSAAICSEDAFVFLDSDLAFVRKFEPGLICENGRVGLLDVSYVDGSVQKWTAIAADLLGLPEADCAPRGHVGYIVAWTRRHLEAMLARIEEVKGVPWQIAIGRKRTFSEYILYGAFIRCVVGYDRSDHVAFSPPLVRQPWDHDFSTPEGIRDFICNVEPGNIAVMIHSKYGLSPADLRPHFERAWKNTPAR